MKILETQKLNEVWEGAGKRGFLSRELFFFINSNNTRHFFGTFLSPLLVTFYLKKLF